MLFIREKTLHFQHCDPAGIIFFPRLGQSSLDYTVEAWVNDALCAHAHTTVVQMSLDTRRAVPFDDELRAHHGLSPRFRDVVSAIDAAARRRLSRGTRASPYAWRHHALPGADSAVTQLAGYKGVKWKTC